MASQRFVIRSADRFILGVPLTMVGYLAQMAGHGETADLVPGEGDRRIDLTDESGLHVEIVNDYY